MSHLITAQDLQTLIQTNPDNLLVVDLSSQDNFIAGHIKGAIWLDYKLTQAINPPHGYLPDLMQLTNLFADLGHTTDKTYIIYDDEGGGWAGRFAWILDSIHHHNYYYLDGGRTAWLAADLPLATQIYQPHRTNPQLQINHEPTANLSYLCSKIGDPNTVIWDARSADEYNGIKVLAKKGGHVPSSVNLEWTQCMDANKCLRKDLPQILTKLGITADKEIITYCQSHHRSGFTYLVAKILGFSRIKAYAGAWSEFGNL